MLHRGSDCSLARAMDGRILRCGIISSCQSAATSEIVKRSWARVYHGAALYQVSSTSSTPTTDVWKTTFVKATSEHWTRNVSSPEHVTPSTTGTGDGKRVVA